MRFQDKIVIVIGGNSGMSPGMVHHYSKRARALTVARGAADRVTGRKIFAMAGVK